ncbi:hypothetical protein NKDENANG_03463 [Candidatus Entotheonellaceae bacterium PAL068K]
MEERRRRLIKCETLYGGALGAATLLVSFLAQTPFPKTPERMALLPSAILSSSGGVAGGILAGLTTYWMAQNTDRARHPLAWMALGWGYGVLLPFCTGMFLPVCSVFLNRSLGVIARSEIAPQVLNALFRAPATAFVHGAFGLYTGLLAGVCFGTGAWLIDRANTASNPMVSQYGTYTLALVLAIAVVAVAAFVPPVTLAKLG